MKKTIIIILSVVAAIALIIGAIFLFGDEKPTIVGGWETEVQVLNSFTEGEDAPGKLQFYFYEDLTGKEITIVNGRTNERQFTYELADGKLRITFESDTEWNFPCTLEKDTLVLTQHDAPVTYHRISE